VSVKTVLALSPHPDDVELGCGGTLYRLREEGARIVLVRFAMCDIGAEAARAAALLDAHAVFDLLYERRTLPAHRQHVLDELIQLRDRFKPDIVFAPAGTDDHQDHAVVHAEAARAFKHTTLLGYELPWNVRSNGSMQLYVGLTGGHIKQKLALLECYKSQQGKRYLHPEFIRSLAYVRAVQCDRLPFAEAFEVVRGIV
jgi:LmbE family N-acetylglucosaminyl deacetylase